MPERLQLREGWSSLVLLVAMLLAMALSFGTGGLAEGLRILPGIVLLGVLIGAVVAKTGLPSFLAHPLGLLAGIGACFALVGTLLILPLDVPMVGAPSFGPAAAAEARWLLLQQHLGTWLGVLVRGEIGRDPLPFVVQIAALAWLVSFYGAWFVFRSHRVWAAVLPVTLITFVSVYYAPPRLLVYFVLCLFAGLLLVARSNVYQREMEWQQEHVLYEPHIGFDILRAGTQLSLFLLVLVWLVPRPEFQRTPLRDVATLRAPWQRVQEEWRRLFSSLSYGGQKVTAPFGRAVTLGGAVEFADTPVLKIEVSAGHYWRAMVLDQYTGRGWVDTNPASLSLGPDAPLVDRAALRAREVLTQTVTLLRPGEQFLYAAGEPWRVSVATRVQAASTPQGEQQSAGQLEVSAIYPPAGGTGGRYAVQSLISTASAKKLAEAPMDYPDWITARYLQLPGTLPARIGELARRVAGDAPTPYDQAQAIEAYLRKLTYNRSIAAPPADRDPVEWFLFEYRQGYCTYFASAMVLMCRSLGLPARFVQGYATGEYDKQQGAMVVRELDAHAWPEVYFPGYGWIEFEPTPARAPIVRPAEGLGRPAPTPGPTPDYLGGRGPQDREHRLPEPDRGTGGASRRSLAAWQRLPWAAMVGALLLAALAWALSRPLARRWRSLRPAERLYLQLTWAAVAAGVSSEPYQTPLEFGRSLAEALGPGRNHVARIVQVYVRERFGGGVSDMELRAARGAWQMLRRMVPGQVLRNRLRNRR